MAQNNKICAMSTTLLCQIVKNVNTQYGKVEQFTLSLYEINCYSGKGGVGTSIIWGLSS
jgi:hypothetical protein